MTSSRPDISVIIPTFNRREICAVVIRALEKQTLASDRYEVIVVDDGSSDGTFEATTAMAAKLSFKLTCVKQPNRGASAARNRGIDLATGRLLLILNDDAICTPVVLAEHMRLHDSKPSQSVAVLGRMTISPELPFSVFHALHLDAAFDQYAGKVELDWTAFFTCNVSVKADFLRLHGRFDERLRWHEDLEAGLRLHKQGLKLLYAPQAIAHHYHALDERAYFRMADLDGRALAQWYRQRPELLPELVGIGLHSRSLGTHAPRHVVADLAVNTKTAPLLAAVARGVAPQFPELSRILYRKLFQSRKRAAIEAELATSRPLPRRRAAMPL